MHLRRLNNGEKIAGVSAILLLGFMFFHWFGVESVQEGNLLSLIMGFGSAKNAWQALILISRRVKT